MKRLGVVMMAMLSLCGTAGCEAEPPRDGSTWPQVDTNHDARWTPYPHAFPVAGNWLTGPVQLIPTSDGCFIGVGSDSTRTGSVPAIWTATGGCSTTKLDRLPGGGDMWLRRYGGLESAVVTDDGTFLAVGQTHDAVTSGRLTTSESFAVRGKPGAWWPPVNRFPTLTGVKPELAGPDVLVARPGGGFIAVGESGPALSAWSSDDGIFWNTSPIPIPEGMRNVEIVSAAAAKDGAIVVMGMQSHLSTIYQSQPLAWFSADRGSSWRSAAVPLDPGARPASLVHDGKRFVAVGTVQRDGSPSSAWVLTSSDGVTWQRDPSLEPATVRSFSAATALSDGRIAAVAVSTCPGVFFLGAPPVTEESLGCNPLPSGIVQLRDGRLALWKDQHLWLRSAPAP